MRLYYKALGANVVSDESAFDGVHGLLLYGKREASERKYTNIRDQSVAVLNSVGVIPSDLWLACQEKLAHNAQIKNSGKGRHTWLSGLIKCAKCGYSIKVQTEKQHRRMICSGRYNLAHCDAKIAAGLDELEASVAAEIEKLLLECPADEAPAERDAFAAKLAEEVDVPVIVVGGFRSVDTMEAVLNSTKIELLSLSRPLLREPDFPNKLESGESTVSKCISCNACYSSKAHRCVFRK